MADKEILAHQPKNALKAKPEKPLALTSDSLQPVNLSVTAGQRTPQAVLRMQQTVGNRAVQRLLENGSRAAKTSPGDPASSFQTSKIPENPSRVDSLTSEKEEEEAGPISEGEGAPGAAAPAVGAAAPAAGPAASAPAIRTMASMPAPDGTPSSRKTVGVKEDVDMTIFAPAIWSCGAGTITPGIVSNALWTAPENPGTYTITAEQSSGVTSTVDMTVIGPTQRVLTKQTDRAYQAGQAGSGFVARVEIYPLSVSFTGIEVREGSVNAVATGYYLTALNWNNIVHPLGKWLPLDRNNSGIQDTVGTNPPGTPAPFSAGTFTWPIPQNYRSKGGGAEINYSTGTHTQVMADATGAETTDKEGASGSRTP